jgi:hypothetical protein
MLYQLKQITFYCITLYIVIIVQYMLHGIHLLRLQLF